MARKKKDNTPVAEEAVKANIIGAGEVVTQQITETLETNFMPYAMSVIVSRAIPEIDGFKPSHRKLLYTMYKMGLINGGRIKSANIVGRTMQLNPHGDAAIYETMVRLSKGNETLLHPYIDSKGNFGKAYSKNMVYAAARYTEAKLESICSELFSDIDKDTVDFVDNYDSTMKEPTLLPVTFPSVLVNTNSGIAVGMASNICSFNLRELCDTTIGLVKNPDFDVFETLKAPDFIGGGQIIYDRAALEEVYNTGRGSIKIRAKYSYDKSNNCIDITEIPPTTTCEAIIEKIIEKVKAGSLKEISDVRDETDKSGLKITIDLKRGTDAESLMKRLYKMTPLEDNFSANFNILVAGVPRVMGVAEILSEWIAFRTECVSRRVYYDLTKAKDKLHLLLGLKKILLDIDKAIKIVRETEEEAEVVPNLMIGFGIDEIQAEYVAEIKLRHLNREYILKRLADVDDLKKSIEDMEDILNSKSRIKKIIVDELTKVSQKYGKDRKSEIIYDCDVEEELVEEIPDYEVNLFFTRGGYFKKITPLSLRMGGEHKFKEGDEMSCAVNTTNTAELLFFTDMCQVYKARACDFDDTKASVLGDYVATKLQMEPDETATFMAVVKEYKGYMLFFFQNGKVAKVELKGYQTKLNRKKLTNAYSIVSPLVQAIYIREDCDVCLISNAGKAVVFNTEKIAAKSTKSTQGVSVMQPTKNSIVSEAKLAEETGFKDIKHYRPKNIPAKGSFIRPEDEGTEQMTLFEEI